MARTTHIFLNLLLIATFAHAQEHHHHDETLPVQGLGNVSFPISCATSDQQDFDRGMALLHSFSYKNARLQFQQIA